MTDGEMLKELRELAKKEGALKTAAALRLICTAQLDLVDTFHDFKDEASGRDEIIGSLRKEVGAVSTSLAEMKLKLDLMCLNPVIKVGAFIRSNTKLSILILVMFLLVSNLWFIQEFRYAVLRWIGVPMSIIEVFNHIVTPVP
jgi:hypothetical protein